MTGYTDGLGYAVSRQWKRLALRIRRPKNQNGLFFGLVVRVILLIVANLIAIAVLVVWGAWSNWRFDQPAIGIAFALVGLFTWMAEHIRSRVYERTRIGRGPHASLEIGKKGVSIDGNVVDWFSMSASGRRRSGRIIKRLLDISIAFVTLFMLLPFLVMVAVVIKMESRGPALVRHKRYDVEGREVTLLGFSVYHSIDGQAPKRTQIGIFLERTAMNRLPRLVDILLGKMSLIGVRPRRQPEPIGNIDITSPGAKIGLSGPAIFFRQRVGDGNTIQELEENYTQHWSLRADLRIIWLTLRKGFLEGVRI